MSDSCVLQSFFFFRKILIDYFGHFLISVHSYVIDKSHRFVNVKLFVFIIYRQWVLPGIIL